MRLREIVAASAFVVASVALSGTVTAAPTVISTRPTRDPANGELTFFVGGIDEAGRSMKASELELVVDGARLGPPAGVQSLSDWSIVTSEASQTWKPPLSLGLVYLWIDGVPAGVLDGVQAFCQRVPSRTVVYPTIYGRLRQGRARLAASEIGKLESLPHLESYRPNLVEAVGLDLPDLAADGAPLKILLLVTDGRDYADPKGEEPGDFATLGRQIRAAGVTPLIVAFPFPDVDAEQVSKNLSDLHDAAGGFLRVLDQADDLENTLESLGQALGDLQRVSVVEPWNWGWLGGTHRVSVRMSAGGQKLNADVGTVIARGGGGRVALLIVVGLGAVAGVVSFVFHRRSRRRADEGGDGDEDGDDEAIVATAHDLIRRGASPQRAVDELSRAHGSAVSAVVNMNPELLSDPRFPYFRTRPGRLRIKEIQDILTKKSTVRPTVGRTLAGVLASAIKGQMAPEEAAKILAARVADDEATAFAGLGLEQLAEVLREAARTQPALGTPRARGAAVAIQDALRSGSSAIRGVAVGWLVRTGGPGRRGETLRLASGRSVIGRGVTCAVKIDEDPALANEHAEIVVEAGVFTINSIGGLVKIEGNLISGRKGLTDGETIEMGAGLYVFKSARSGHLGVGAGGSRAADRSA